MWMSFPDPHHPWDPPSSEWHRVDWPELALPDAYPSSVEATIKVLAEKPRHWLDWYLGKTQFNYEIPAEFKPCELTADQIREVNALTHIENELIDEALGRVLTHLDKRGWGEDTDVIYSTDHGEFQGDFGMLFKGPYHVDALMRVPLIWKPAARGAVQPAVIEQPVGHVDLARTIFAIAGVEADARMQGAVLPQMPNNNRERVITEWDGSYQGHDLRLRTICRDGYVCTVCEPGTDHQGDEGELYDLRNDPRQWRNLWGHSDFAALQAELIADLYDNLPPARSPALAPVALV